MRQLLFAMGIGALVLMTTGCGSMRLEQLDTNMSRADVGHYDRVGADKKTLWVPAICLSKGNVRRGRGGYAAKRTQYAGPIGLLACRNERTQFNSDGQVRDYRKVECSLWHLLYSNCWSAKEDRADGGFFVLMGLVSGSTAWDLVKPRTDESIYEKPPRSNIRKAKVTRSYLWTLFRTRNTISGASRHDSWSFLWGLVGFDSRESETARKTSFRLFWLPIVRTSSPK